MRYSMRRVSVRNSSVAVRPFRAVHLKSRRFHCFSDDIFFHQSVVSFVVQLCFYVSYLLGCQCSY